MPAQHTRSTGLLCGRLVALELFNVTRQPERSGSWQGRLQTSAEDAFIYTVLEHLAYLKMFQDDTLYILTYMYLLTWDMSQTRTTCRACRDVT